MAGDGEMSRLGEIEIAAYDPAWPRVYAEEAARLVKLAEGAFSNIEHIGSTAVPGLRAKPVIDVMASTADLACIELIAPRLCEEGYREMSGTFSFRRFFRKPAEGEQPAFHLHVVADAAWPGKSERVFRDWLIANQETAEAYSRLKDALALRFARDREAYTDAKSAFIRAAVNTARQDLGLSPLADWDE